MYLEHNFSIVPQSEFILNKKAQTIILRDFPTTFVTDENGANVEVFSRMYVYNGSVTTNEAYDNVMKLFGTSAEDLRGESWKGVDNAYFNFKYVMPSDTVITYGSLYNEIFLHAVPLAPCQAIFNLVSYDILTPASEILADFNSGTNLGKYGKYIMTDEVTEEETYTNTNDQNWYIVYADTGQQAFNRTVSVKAATSSTEITGYRKVYDGIGGYKDVPITRTTYSTKIVMDYSRKEVADVASAIEMEAVFARVRASNTYDVDFLDNYFIDGVDDIYTNIPIGYNPFTQEPMKFARYLKVESVRAMKLKTFAKVIAKAFHFGYSLKKAEWWEIIVAVILIIIIIIVAVIVCLGTAGAGCGFASMAAFNMLATVVAIAATVIVIALSIYSQILTDNGYYGSQATLGRMIVFFSEVAKYAGYVAILTGGINIYKNGWTTAAPGAGAKALSETHVIVDGLNTTYMIGETIAPNAVIAMSPSAIFAQVASWVSTAGNLYLEYGVEDPYERVEDAQAKVDKQEATMSEFNIDTAVVGYTPKAIVALEEDRYNNTFAEVTAQVNDVADKFVYNKIYPMTHMYYDDVI